MSEKCYIVQFTAHLHKLSLALRMNCQVQIIWKRGQKNCKSGKFILERGVAIFDKKISINCNMLYNSKAKIFQEKITEFSIVLSSDKGTKQAGRLLFDVAEYVNQKQLNKKDYEVNLEECPDRNAKIFFTLSGVLAKEIEADQISQSSYSNPIEGITNSIIIPSSSSNKKISQRNQSGFSKEKKNTSSESDEKLNRIEEQNKRMKEQIKKIEKIKKENDELRKVIKSEQFKKVTEIKQKMEKMKEQIQKMKADIKANKNMESEIKKNQNEILQCKIKIMKALNFCAQYGGSDLLDAVQNYCGMLEKQ